VTGGSRGVGAAVCRRLAAVGDRVFCIFRSHSVAAGDLKAELEKAGLGLDLLKTDVTDPVAVEAAVARVNSEAGCVDILVNVAGGVDDRLLLRAGAEKVRETLDLNLASALTVCRAALPSMLRSKWGRIVNISSVVASMGNAGQSVYGAAKAGLEGFSRSLAREVGSRGVTVNCVAPGFIETEMTSGLEPELRQKALAATALGRSGSADEVAEAVAFLCSDGAGYITGTVLHVNGGMYM
jgi:3-oxoacyl-[acyl-carrier protein] reductase